ncbi:hypothetical protein PILCRDRAFT_814989 [Piloderma croceum F 1598]|uniref:Uncharacterized protein n=1 Tax=Piloderma croceum (strain F 1598) TaxID=765440 RepID=A0A0C3G6L8_PILCF|nr:hypothetical protein PILCRDRAFT_814989 [Piloderma croceum F 1598]
MYHHQHHHHIIVPICRCPQAPLSFATNQRNATCLIRQYKLPEENKHYRCNNLSLFFVRIRSIKRSGLNRIHQPPALLTTSALYVYSFISSSTHHRLMVDL